MFSHFRQNHECCLPSNRDTQTLFNFKYVHTNVDKRCLNSNRSTQTLFYFRQLHTYVVSLQIGTHKLNLISTQKHADVVSFETGSLKRCLPLNRKTQTLSEFRQVHNVVLLQIGTCKFCFTFNRNTQTLSSFKQMHTKVVFVSLSVVFLQKGTNRRCFHSHMYKQTLSHLKQEPTNVVSFQIRTNVVSLQKEHINLILHQTGTQKC